MDCFDNNAGRLRPYDPASAPTGRDPAEGGVFQGGNLRGIIRRLDYIQGLGANAKAAPPSRGMARHGRRPIPQGP